MEHKGKVMPARTLLVLAIMLHVPGCANQLPAAGINSPVTIVPEAERLAIVFKAGRPAVH